jgi:hypothetical protein
MRLRYCLFPFTLLLCCCYATLTAHAQQFDERLNTHWTFFTTPDAADAVTPRVPAPTVPQPAPLALKGRNAHYRAAYVDTYRVLSAPGVCSDFFGGSAFALEVFNDLVARLQTGHMHTSEVGMQMDGETTNVIKTSTGQAYRLFARALVNSDGPFFRDRNSSPDGAFMPRVGSFAPNSRGARVLILLHELAHLIRRPDGDWLIPNDGHDSAQSERNTALVESICGAEIRALDEN